MNIQKYNTSKNWIIGAIILLFLVGGYFYFSRTPNYIKISKKELKLTKDSILTLKNDLKKSNIIIENYNKQLLIKDSVISIKKTKILYIKERTDEKINNVDMYTVSDLDGFFSDRYKER